MKYTFNPFQETSLLWYSSKLTYKDGESFQIIIYPYLISSFRNIQLEYRAEPFNNHLISSEVYVTDQDQFNYTY